MLGAFVLILAVFSTFASIRVLEAGYKKLARARAATLSAVAQETIPQQWEALLAGKVTPLSPVFNSVDSFLRAAIAPARYARIKIYGTRGRVLFSLNKEQVGEIESNQAIADAVTHKSETLKQVTEDSGESYYEIYVPLLNKRGEVRAVVELYEAASQFQKVLWKNALPPAVVSVVVLAVLIAILSKLVSRAQLHINERTDELVSLRRKLETFLSQTAVGAAKDAQGGDIPSRRVECTILYTDVRDFTGYSESHSPEDVVSFLNDLFRQHIRAVSAYGGDVDKFIGDAVLAWFEGEKSQERAVLAAQDILNAVKAGSPRSVGAGVFSGSVISGAVGPKERQDFTIIGDSVNVAARLCSEAQGGEIVMDAFTASKVQAQTGGLSEIQEIYVKGRSEPLLIQRLSKALKNS